MINPTDGYYKAEQISPEILAMRGPLCAAYHVGLGNFGSKGNLNHDSGYHRSRAWILHSPDSQYGDRDYSIILPADAGNTGDCSAFDFTPGVWGSPDNRAKVQAITRRVIEAMQAGDARVSSLREFAGSLDGVHVVTFDQSRHAFKAPFDSSHLEHVHGSIYRTKTRVDHSGIVSVMLGENMATFTDQQLADLLYTLGIGGNPNGPHAIHARLNVLEGNIASIMATLEGLAARPATVTLEPDQVVSVSDAARDGAVEGVGRLRLTVEPA